MLDVDTVLKETLTSIEASSLAKSTLGDLLKQYRTAHSIHQKDLATQLNISSAYLSDVENGRRAPSTELIKRLRSLI